MPSTRSSESPHPEAAPRRKAPFIGSLVVAVWLLGITINLLILGGFHDVGLRDFGLLVGALALNRLATARSH
ncbi:MAG TPA: hypothetical protein VIQ52_02040 [Arthrobacter sp.]